jgi:hypothetical protein
VEAVHTVDDLTVHLVTLELVCDVDPADDEDSVFLLLDLPADVSGESPFARIDPARLQRAPEGTG